MIWISAFPVKFSLFYRWWTFLLLAAGKELCRCRRCKEFADNGLTDTAVQKGQLNGHTWFKVVNGTKDSIYDVVKEASALLRVI